METGICDGCEKVVPMSELEDGGRMGFRISGFWFCAECRSVKPSRPRGTPNSPVQPSQPQEKKCNGCEQ